MDKEEQEFWDEIKNEVRRGAVECVRCGAPATMRVRVVSIADPVCDGCAQDMERDGDEVDRYEMGSDYQPMKHFDILPL